MATLAGSSLCMSAVAPTAHAGPVERPGAAPAAGDAPDDAPAVGFVSDSMGHTATDEITEEVTKDRDLSYLSTIQGADISDHRDDLIALTEGTDGPDILAIMLGTAQADHEGTTVAGFEADMRDLLDHLSPLVDCIRWFELQDEPAPFYARFTANRRAFNRVIHRVVDDYANVEYFHYSAWVDLAPRSFRWWDDLHLLPPGDRELGRMVRAIGNGCDPAVTSGPFWDVPDRHWAAGDITWLTAGGLATGYDNHSYRAEVGRFAVPVSRGQLVQMLWKSQGSPVEATRHGFTDTTPWLDPALDWARAEGLVDGYPDGTFRPGRPITRAAATRLLWRLADSPTDNPDSAFTDIPPWLDPDAVDWITTTGDPEPIATGWPDNTYRPSQPLTRAQIARMLHRLLTTPPPNAHPQQATTPTTTAASPTTATSTTGPPTTAPTTTTVPVTAPSAP